MMTRHPLSAAVAAGAAALASLMATPPAHAHGDVPCPAHPAAEWQPQMALQKQLEAAGWRVRQVKTSGRCYEVYGFDPQGRRAESFFDPKTFELIAASPTAVPATGAVAASAAAKP